MRIRILIASMLLVITNNSTLAEWVKVGDDTYTAIYADPATIRKTGNIVRMWQMVDYKMPADSPALERKDIKSVKLHAEYNCGEGQVRALYVSQYYENMGRGTAIWAMPHPTLWESVPSGISENLWKLPCARK